MLVPLDVDREETFRSEWKAGPIIEAMRRRASEIAREELDRTVKRIGADQEVEARLAAMARAVVCRLLEAPSARLRQAGPARRRLIGAAVEMFGLAVEDAPARERR